MGASPDDTAPGYNPEKNRAFLESLLEKSPAELSEEVSSLLGHAVKFSDMENSFLSEEEILAKGSAKQVIAEMSFGSGESRLGLGYLVCPVKGAIELGGVLIMLPDSEIEKSASEEDFYEDLQDAYGEIANIVSGFYNRIFEQRYTPAKTRVIRKDVSLVNTVKDKDLLARQVYYCCSMAVSLKEKSLGRIQMLFPAVALKLFAGEIGEAEAAGDKKKESVDFPVGEKLERQQQKIVAILEEGCSRCQQEISSLISADVTLGSPDNTIINKGDFFAKEVRGKQILSFMATRGEDVTTESFIVVDIKAAIHMGGVLVMLPPPELEAAVEKELFSDDIADAYGEIANIITGAYTSTFEELYKKQLHFVRKNSIEITPLTVDTDSDEPFADGDYYLSRMTILIGGREYGRLNMLFPLDALRLQGLVHAESVTEGAAQRGDRPPAPATEGEAADAGGGDIAAEKVIDKVYDILLIGDDEASAGMITKGFDALGLSAKTISFKDEVRDFLGDQVRAVYLVTREVNEQAFGMAIKLSSSSSSLPIIAAAPAWTRSKVIKAVRYGVKDILVTPATDDEIAANIQKNIH